MDRIKSDERFYIKAPKNKYLRVKLDQYDREKNVYTCHLVNKPNALLKRKENKIYRRFQCEGFIPLLDHDKYVLEAEKERENEWNYLNNKQKELYEICKYYKICFEYNGYNDLMSIVKLPEGKDEVDYEKLDNFIDNNYKYCDDYVKIVYGDGEIAQ